MESAAHSVHGVLVRLTEERWAHIVEEHGELEGMREDVLNTLQRPQRVVAGRAGELLALREARPGTLMVVVYREGDYDGFVITAFLTRRVRSLDRRTQVWPPLS